MDIAEIRALRLARPFRPFVLVLDDGRELEVDYPYALGIAPSGKELSFISKLQAVTFLRPSDVREVKCNGSMNSNA